MNRIISTVVAAILIGIAAVGQSATAAARTSGYSAQPSRSYSDQFWRSYPYYNGTYEGRPVSEWLRPVLGDASGTCNHAFCVLIYMAGQIADAATAEARWLARCFC